MQLMQCSKELDDGALGAFPCLTTPAMRIMCLSCTVQAICFATAAARHTSMAKNGKNSDARIGSTDKTDDRDRQDERGRRENGEKSGCLQNCAWRPQILSCQYLHNVPAPLHVRRRSVNRHSFPPSSCLLLPSHPRLQL